MLKIVEINERYRNGDLQSLVPLLQQNLMFYLEKGDDTAAACTLAEYGIIQLFLGDHYATSVIWKQISDEYHRDQPDPRKKAAYSRFLGLYEAFAGNKNGASAYYRESFMQFDQLDWYDDEAFMILEAIYFYCLPYEDRSLLFQGINRLQHLQPLQDSRLYQWIKLDLALLDQGLHFLTDSNQRGKFIKLLENSKQESYWFGSFYFWVTSALVTELLWKAQPSLQIQTLHERDKLPLQQFSMFLNEIHQCSRTETYSTLQDLTERLKAKAHAFEHPWYCLIADAVFFICHREAPFTTLENSAEYKPFLSNSIINLWKHHPSIPVRHEMDLPLPSQGFKICLFQNPILYFGDKKLDLMEWKSTHLREFFLYVIMHPQGRISKEVVMEELFLNDDLKKSMNRLYVTIHRVNRFLHDYFHIQDPFIQIQQGFVYFNQDLVEEIDVQVYRKLASVASQLWHDDQEAAIELMQKANKIFQSDLLTNFLYIDWLEKYRENLLRIQGKLLRRLAGFYSSTGRKRDYEESAQQLIQLFPYDESLYHDFISYLLKEKRQLEAYHWYSQLKLFLDQELGIAPSFEFIK